MTLELFENNDDDQLHKMVMTKLQLVNFFRLFLFWVVPYYCCDQAVSLMGGLGVGRCDSGWEPRIAEQDYQSFLGFCVFVFCQR